MKLQIGDYTLDSQKRTLNSGNVSQKIRPKTLSLLVYLAERPGQIISKQELLNQVWDDVAVDEGVVFQSIREIRHLLGSHDALLNHPRKGYQLTLEVGQVASSSKQVAAPHKVHFPQGALLVVLVTITLALLATQFFSTPRDTAHRIMVLPVKNHVQFGDHDWVSLGAMEQLIANLTGLPDDNLVYSGTQVIRHIHQSGLTKNIAPEEATKLLAVSGASMVVETELHGNSSDYKLVYRIHDSTGTKEGVLLDPKIAEALKSLALIVAQQIDVSLNQQPRAPQQEFSDALFAKAMISYESDWQSSISFFQSYLALNPNSVIAHIYLSKLYLWQDKPIDAANVIDKASKLKTGFIHDQAHIKLIQGRVSARQGNYAQAHEYFEQAQRILIPLNRWFLKASIAEEQGLTFLAQQQADQAIRVLTQALNFYQITQSPIGINSTRLHLSRAFHENGQVAEAKEYFQRADYEIRQSQLDFLYDMLERYADCLKALPDQGDNP